MNGRLNEYWNASPLRPKSGSNIATVTYAVLPCYRCSPSFRNELLVLSWLVVLISPCFCLPFTPRGGWRIKITVTQIMKRYYRKQCILRHHEINDRTEYETIDFLFRPSDIYRHIAQPYVSVWCSWYLEPSLSPFLVKFTQILESIWQSS